MGGESQIFTANVNKIQSIIIKIGASSRFFQAESQRLNVHVGEDPQ